MFVHVSAMGSATVCVYCMLQEEGYYSQRKRGGKLHFAGLMCVHTKMCQGPCIQTHAVANAMHIHAHEIQIIWHRCSIFFTAFYHLRFLFKDTQRPFWLLQKIAISVRLMCSWYTGLKVWESQKQDRLIHTCQTQCFEKALQQQTHTYTRKEPYLNA